MAGKKENYRRRKKSNARKKYRKYKTVFKSTSGFPSQLYTKLVYSEQVQFNTTTGNIVNNTWSGNSVFDPNVTSTGHQPYFYDQLTAVYNSYIVYGSKIEVHASTNNATDSRMVVRPAIPATAVGDMDLECERPGAICKNVCNGARETHIKMYRSTNRVYGTQKKKDLDENFQAASNANPNNRWYWLTAVQATDELSTTAVQATIKVTYYCRFFDRATVGQS